MENKNLTTLTLSIIMIIALIVCSVAGYYGGIQSAEKDLQPKIDLLTQKNLSLTNSLSSLYGMVEVPYSVSFDGLSKYLMDCRATNKELVVKSGLLSDLNDRVEMCSDLFYKCSWAASYWSNYHGSVGQLGDDFRDYYTTECLGVSSRDWNFVMWGKR